MLKNVIVNCTCSTINLYLPLFTYSPISIGFQLYSDGIPAISMLYVTQYSLIMVIATAVGI